MLIIGHRGAAGLAPENTIASLKAGFEAGSDILEFDVRITSDGIPILAHDAWIKGKSIRKHTYDELRALADIATLDDALSSFFGKILINIELKQSDHIDTVLTVIRPYVKHDADWEDIIFSSFKVAALKMLRSQNEHANLALLHHILSLIHI